MKRTLNTLKSLTLLFAMFAFLGAGILTSCRDTKKKEEAEQVEAEASEHPEGEEHPAGEEHPSGDEHPSGEEHPTQKDSTGN
jgi:hypothetical protein